MTRAVTASIMYSKTFVCLESGSKPVLASLASRARIWSLIGSLRGATCLRELKDGKIG